MTEIVFYQKKREKKIISHYFTLKSNLLLPPHFHHDFNHRINISKHEVLLKKIVRKFFEIFVKLE